MVINHATCPSLTAMVMEQAESLADHKLLWSKQNGAWQGMTWAETRDKVYALAGGLLSLGLVPSDRVVLVSENRPEWAIADLAIMAAGGISVPAYTTNTNADHRYILDHSGARFAIVSTPALAEHLLAAARHCVHPPVIIPMEMPRHAQSSGVTLIPWEQVLRQGAGREADITARIAATQRSDVACLIYTSGTGGAPKGVMLSHGAILANCLGAYLLLRQLGMEDEVFLSFLPLSHAYEHTAGLFFPLSIGAQIYYAEGIDHLSANLLEVHPTIMTAVPRLYESMRARILRAMQRESGLLRRLFEATLGLGTRRIEAGRLGPLDAVADVALERLVRRKFRARFGGRLKAMVSGGAPLAYEIGLFFTALGLRVLQGYGQTEAAPLISCNPPDCVRLDSVGPPVEGVQIRIGEDGEILAAGEMVMQGYWNDPEATAQVLRDGWLHTGDIGEMDAHGYLRITDRKKDIIVNSGGDNISPARIEGLLTLQPEIAQAMTYGDRRPHLVALLVPADSYSRQALAEAVDRVNRTLSNMEKIRRFAVVTEPFTVDNGMLTPTLKIRRHRIREVHGAMLTGLYE